MALVKWSLSNGPCQMVLVRVRNLAIGKRETWKHGRRKRKREWGSGSGSGEGKMRIKAKMLCEIPGAHLCFDERAT